MGQVVGIGDVGAQVEFPVMPVAKPGEQLRKPYPLGEGSQTIGWQYPHADISFPEFVIISRKASGRLKVTDSFPLTEKGWASAWRALATLSPQEAAEVAARLRQRAAETVPAARPADEPTSGGPSDNAVVGFQLLMMACGLLMVLLALGVYGSQGSPAVAKSSYMSRGVFLLILMLGLADIAFGVLAPQIQRGLARLAAAHDHHISRVGSVTIIAATRHNRVLFAVLPIAGPLVAISWLTSTHWFTRVGMAIDGACYVICAAWCIWALWRAWRVAIRFDDEGITVRNLLRTHRLRWPAVRSFADGSWNAGEGGRYWVLTVVPHEGQPIRVLATVRGWTAKDEMLQSIREAARRRGIPAQLAGEVGGRFGTGGPGRP